LTTAFAESRETAVDTSCHNIIVGDVRIAATAATTAAQELGFTTQLLTAHLEGEAREVGSFAAALAKDAPSNYCLILGGETTVTLRGNGIGGRNLETALAAAISLDGWQNCAITSFATDGDDGPTSTAGATVTGETVGNGRQHNLNPTTYLDNNDSYTYFTQLDKQTGSPCLIHTGLTGTNVNDLIFIMKYEN
ncbi:MAG: glycerate kinase, partial [Chloroflexi bacterium]|nr:glycerate kinase [Chloroflexota bacterium]